MKKKLIVFCVLLVIVPAVMFADILQLGVNVGYKNNYATIEDEGVQFKWDNFVFGPDIRLNLLFLGLDVSMDLGFPADAVVLNTKAIGTLYMKLFDFARISLGAGIGMPFMVQKGQWSVNGQSMENFGDVLKDSNLIYRVGLGFIIDPVEIVANWDIPSEGSIRDKEFIPSVKASTFSVGVLFSLV